MIERRFYLIVEDSQVNRISIIHSVALSSILNLTLTLMRPQNPQDINSTNPPPPSSNHSTLIPPLKQVLNTLYFPPSAAKTFHSEFPRYNLLIVSSWKNIRFRREALKAISVLMSLLNVILVFLSNGIRLPFC